MTIKGQPFNLVTYVVNSYYAQLLALILDPQPKRPKPDKKRDLSKIFNLVKTMSNSNCSKKSVKSHHQYWWGLQMRCWLKSRQITTFSFLEYCFNQSTLSNISYFVAIQTVICFCLRIPDPENENA